MTSMDSMEDPPLSNTNFFIELNQCGMWIVHLKIEHT